MMSNEESESPRAGEESAVAPLPTPPPLSGIAQGSEITDIKDVTHTGRKNECPTCGATFSNEQEYAMHIVSQHAEIALEALNSHSVDSVEKEDNTSDVSTDSPDIPTVCWTGHRHAPVDRYQKTKPRTPLIRGVVSASPTSSPG
eukprot:Sspe_Gene.48561::Locus_25398_Transcript_2_5_Confidence_0.600_Length_503::g.48561::m.48561